MGDSAKPWGLQGSADAIAAAHDSAKPWAMPTSLVGSQGDGAEAWDSPASLGTFAQTLKIRGVNLAPNPAEAGPNRGHWHVWLGSGYSSSYIDQQIAWAQQVGANAVTLYLDYYEVMIGTVTLNTYVANLSATLEKIRKAGLLCQVTLVGWGSGSPSGVWAPITGLTGAGSLSDLLPHLAVCTALCDSFAHVIAFDIITESNMAWIQTQLGAGVTMRDVLATVLPTIRANTRKPLSASYQFTATPTGALAADANLIYVVANLDFLNFHTYYGSNNGPGSGNDPVVADFDLVNGIWPTKQILIGEFGSSKTSANLAVTMANARAILERPYMLGAYLWSLNAFQPATAPGFMFSSAGAEQTGVTVPFRTWPRRAVPDTKYVALGGSGAALPGAMADVAGATGNLGQAVQGNREGLDAQFRLNALVGQGLIGGDNVQVDLTDLSNVVIATQNVFVPGTGPSVADAGPNGWTGLVSGLVVPDSSVVAGFGAAVATAGVSYIDFGSHTFAGGVRWTYEMKVKRSRAGVVEKFFVIGGAVNGFPHVELAFNAGNNVTAVGGKTGSGTWSITGSSTVTDTNWHDVAIDWDGASVVRLYVDGVMVGTTTQGASPPSVVGGSPWRLSDSGSPFVGSIDELRASNLARYGSAVGYTPAAAPFSSDASTVLLAHLDAITAGQAWTAPVAVQSDWQALTQTNTPVKVRAANLSGAHGKLISCGIDLRYT